MAAPDPHHIEIEIVCGKGTYVRSLARDLASVLGACGPVSALRRTRVGPFRAAFPDFSMEIVDLVAEEEKVAAHFRCSGTHLGEWMGRPPSGRRFQDVDEIYIFRVRNGKLTDATGVEYNLSRMRQLGLDQ